METAPIVTVLSGLIQVAFITALGVAFYYWFFVLPKRIDRAFNDFAARYGLAFSARGAVTYKGLLPGAMTRTAYGVLKDSNKPAALFYYTHVTGSGKNRKEYERTVAAIGIKPTGSHLFINSKINDVHEVPNLARSQRYEAEGTFSKYFDMYFPGGQQIPALSLFAPDVMAVIMADYGFYDIEIIDDIMYIYDYKYQRTFKELDEFFQLALKLTKEIDSNAPRMLRAAGAGTGAQTDGAPGVQRLKPFRLSLSNVGVIIGAVLLFAVPTVIPRAGTFSVLATLIGMMTILIWVGITLARGEKRRKDYLVEREKFRQ